MNKKAAIYCRVSTNDQKTDMQVRDLRKYAAVKAGVKMYHLAA